MIRVLLITQPRLIGEAVRNIIDQEPDMTVIHCLTDASELATFLPTCDVILISNDIGIERVSHLIGQIRHQSNNVKVVILGTVEVPEIILQYVEAGANGYILQNDSVTDLLSKVRASCDNKAYVSPQMAASLMLHINKMALQQDSLTSLTNRCGYLSLLTPRERQVLTLIGNGLSNREIAMSLVIEVGTVKNHVHRILKKLDVRDRYEAAEVYGLFDAQNPTENHLPDRWASTAQYPS